MTEKTTLVLATANRGKAAEFRHLLDGLPVDVVLASDLLTPMPEIKEDGTTFLENALIKARLVAHATLSLTLADDSGLEVDALAGQPGVRSARYAGERASDAENNAKLLDELRDVPRSERTARFRCALCLIDPWRNEEALQLVEGTCEGLIAQSPRGHHGFGYDPLFVVQGLERTMAELNDAEKNELSHRAQAVQALVPKLKTLLAERDEQTSRLSLHDSSSIG